MRDLKLTEESTPKTNTLLAWLRYNGVWQFPQYTGDTSSYVSVHTHSYSLASVTQHDFFPIRCNQNKVVKHKNLFPSTSPDRPRKLGLVSGNKLSKYFKIHHSFCCSQLTDLLNNPWYKTSTKCTLLLYRSSTLRSSLVLPVTWHGKSKIRECYQAKRHMLIRSSSHRIQLLLTQGFQRNKFSCPFTLTQKFLFEWRPRSILESFFKTCLTVGLFSKSGKITNILVYTNVAVHMTWQISSHHLVFFPQSE